MNEVQRPQFQAISSFMDFKFSCVVMRIWPIEIITYAYKLQSGLTVVENKLLKVERQNN